MVMVNSEILAVAIGFRPAADEAAAKLPSE
jgi:hypothetical protein